MTADDVTVVSIPGPQVVAARFDGQRVLGITVTGQPVVAATAIVQGPQGPPGVPGNTPDVTAVDAVSDWNHAHTFPYLPAVRLIDAQGNAVGVGVQYPDAHTVYISFPHPFTGRIMLT